MRKLLKRVVPAPARRAIHGVRVQLRTPGLFISDARRYLKYSIVPGKPKTLANARAKMMFHAHSLEKGLSRAKMRPLFGESAISELVKATNLWLRNGGSETDEFYLASCSAVGEYVAKHQALGIDPMPKLAAFDQRVLDNAASAFAAIPATDAIVQPAVEGAGGGVSAPANDYRAVVARRRSIREYGTGPLDLGLIKDAVQLSLFSPSVCNRQPARVHVYTAPDVVSAALELQGGMAGYAPPPALVVVTADISSFIAPTERRQPWIDGGLFAMSLLNALEYYGLAACPLNAMFGVGQEAKLRQLLNIPDGEVFIVFMAVGPKPATTLIPHSVRLNLDSVLSLH